MTETVYVGKHTSRQNKVYHTDEDCRMIKSDPRPKKRQPLVMHGYEECEVCAGELEPQGGKGERSRKSLRAMIKDGEVEL